MASRRLGRKEYYISSARNELGLLTNTWRCRRCWIFQRYWGAVSYKLRGSATVLGLTCEKYGGVAIGWNAETQTRSELEGIKVWQWAECYGLGWGLGGGLRCDFVHRWRIFKVGAAVAKKAYSSQLTCCTFPCSPSSNSIILRAIKSRRLVQLETLMSNQCSHKQFLPLLPTPLQMLQSRLIAKATHRKPTPSSRVLHLGFLGHKNHTLQTPYLLQSTPSTIPLLPPPITLMPQP